MIEHSLDAGGRPGCPFGSTALHPGIDLAFQSHFAVGHFDMDTPCLNLRIAFERVFDALLDVTPYPQCAR